MQSRLARADGTGDDPDGATDPGACALRPLREIGHGRAARTAGAIVNRTVVLRKVAADLNALAEDQLAI